MADAIVCLNWGQQSVLSSKRQCVMCGRDVAISLSAARRPGLDPHCFPCGREIIARGAEPGSTLPEIRKELRARGMSDEQIDQRSRDLRKMLGDG